MNISVNHRPRRVFGRIKSDVEGSQYRFEMTKTGLRVRRRNSRDPVEIPFDVLVDVVSPRAVTVREVNGRRYSFRWTDTGVLVRDVAARTDGCVTAGELVRLAGGQQMTLFKGDE